MPFRVDWRKALPLNNNCRSASPTNSSRVFPSAAAASRASRSSSPSIERVVIGHLWREICCKYITNFLADHEARLVDPDAAALLLDLDGNVTETSGANFLIVERGTIVSPTLRNILPGISRQTVIELAGKLSVPFVERDIQVHSVMNADEAFLTSTPFCLMPVTRINGVAIADGQPGPLYRRLIEAWSEAVGMDIVGQFATA